MIMWKAGTRGFELGVVDRMGAKGIWGQILEGL